MSSEWCLEELGTIVTGKTPPKTVDEAFSEFGVPFLTPKDMDGRKWITDTERYLSEIGVSSVKKSVIPVGSVAVSCIGSDMGKAVMVPVTTVTNQQINTIIPDTTKCEPEYLYYLLSTMQQSFKDIAGGSATPILNKGHFGKVTVQLPTLHRQKSVARALGALDDKIQLNQQINQTLEQMAQAIFKSWFIDFEPVRAKMDVLEAGGSEQDALLAAMQAISGKDADQLGRFQTEQPEQYAELKATAELFPSAMQDSDLGEIPEGWQVGKLGELLLLNPRRTLKKGTIAPYLDMKNVPTSGHLAEEVILREMASGTKFINGDTLLARITPCLENGKTAYVDFLRQDQVGWGSTEYIVIRPHDGYPQSIGYLIARDANFRQYAIQSMTGTSGRQRANAKALVDLPWVIYPQDVANAFGKIASVYLKLAKSHGDESKSLSLIRDTLLPKLLSGEISVNDAYNEIKEPASV